MILVFNDILKGLPVLTLIGNSFPSRVASSLIHSIQQNDKTNSIDIYSFLSDILITYSKKSYEDTVIKLLKSPQIINKLKELLSNCSKYQSNSNFTSTSATFNSKNDNQKKSPSLGFFNTQQLVQDFVHGMYAMYESSQIKDQSKKENLLNCLTCRKYPHVILAR